MTLPDFDFETYSEAGYSWGGDKWRSAGEGTKRGLELVGAAAYAEHMSTKLLSLAYDLKDGVGPRLWVPSMLPPYDLIDYLQSGGPIEAHNSGFEWVIWYWVCHRKMGWPLFNPDQLHCSKSKCRAWSLPGALGKAADVLQLPIQKDADGKRLLDKFSKPRNPTKADKRLRLLPEEDPIDGPKLYSYNVQDIAAEAVLSAAVPDLSPTERTLWLIDQRINFRGVQIDVEAVELLITCYEHYAALAEAKIREIAGCSYSEVAKITSWLQSKGHYTASLDAEAIDALLAKATDPMVRRVLEIRRDFGSSSVKKLYSLRHWVNSDGRARYLLEYHGAATGRWAGRGPQPQNMPSKGPKVVRSECCGAIRSAQLRACPYCGIGDPGHSKAEWGPDGVDRVVADARAGKLPHWPDPVAAVSGCLRGLFIAKPGHDLISSDYSAIEAVVLAVMAGEQWRIDVFNTHGKIYEMSASKISGVPFEEIANHKKLHGEHHPLRKGVGKVAELACFSQHTQVLTKTGYKPIISITPDDLLWDGYEWVTSQGVVPKGKKHVLILDGVEMTPNHPINCGRSWQVAKRLVLSKNTRHQALAFASARLPQFQATKTTDAGESLFNATAGRRSMLLSGPICEQGKRRGAMLAQKFSQKKRGTQNTTLDTKRRYLTTSTGVGYSTDCPPHADDVKTRPISNTPIMGGAGSRCARSGATTKRRFSGMSRPLMGGTARSLKWTGRTLTKGTNPATSGLSLNQRMRLTRDQYSGCKRGSTSWKDVYDIAHAGPRNQFTIKTDSGHMIVHNSGYAGWIGAWKAFGADSFMAEQEIKQAILAWRAASPMIVEFWGGQWRKDPDRWQFTPELYGVEGAAVSAVLNPGQFFQYRGVTWGIIGSALYCQLPSGRFLTYHSPRLDETTDQRGLKVWSLSYMGEEPTTKQWVRIPTYGGKLTENIVQAVARDILANALVNLEAAGYPVVLHVHDEVVSEIPQGFGSVEEFERIMATMPAWASGWPIKAAGGWRGRRYRKD